MQALLFVKDRDRMSAFYLQALGSEAIRDLMLHAKGSNNWERRSSSSPGAPSMRSIPKLIYSPSR